MVWLCSKGSGLKTLRRIYAASRRYIHDLETRCDKSGDVQTIASLREDRKALQKRVEELALKLAGCALDELGLRHERHFPPGRVALVTLHSNPGITLVVFNIFLGFNCMFTALKSRTVAHKTRTKILLKFGRDISTKMTVFFFPASVSVRI
jgi:hypothetical protein